MVWDLLDRNKPRTETVFSTLQFGRGAKELAEDKVRAFGGRGFGWILGGHGASHPLH